jgi:hypothetical protein
VVTDLSPATQRLVDIAIGTHEARRKLREANDEIAIITTLFRRGCRDVEVGAALVDRGLLIHGEDDKPLNVLEAVDEMFDHRPELAPVPPPLEVLGGEPFVRDGVLLTREAAARLSRGKGRWRPAA